MDPLSLIGGVSAAGAIIAAITKTVKSLSDAQGKFDGADLTISLLIVELRTVESALTEIQRWAQNKRVDPSQADVIQAFRISFDGCQLAMDSLAQEVADLVSNNPFRRRARYVWNDESMKEHKDRLHSQIAALQLLLQAVHCHTQEQQTALLRQPISRSIIKKVADDTSTLRGSIAGSSGAPTVIGRPESTITNSSFIIGQGSEHFDTRVSTPDPHVKFTSHDAVMRTVSDATNPFRRGQPKIVAPSDTTDDSGIYDMDADIVNTVRYQQTVAQRRAKGNPNLAQRSVSDGGSYAMRGISPDRIRTRNVRKQPEWDETRDQLSPMERFASDWRKPEPYDGRAARNQHANHSPPSRPVRHKSSASDPVITHHLSVPQETKKSIVRTLTGRISKMNLASSGQQATPNSSSGSLNPSPGSRRVKRKNELNIHTSIDFGSADGLRAPDIIQAAQSRSRIRIIKLLEQRIDIDERHEGSGRTALAVASHCGSDDVVALLLHHGANVDAIDNDMMTPLHLAASRGHDRVVEVLLTGHADVEAIGPDKKTPLRIASDKGYDRVVELLLRDRARVNARDVHNSTALHAASKLGDLDIVKLLIQHGADYEAKDGDMMTALHRACEGDHDEVAELLLMNKANIETTGKKAMTPLSCACASGSKRVTELLLRRKANMKHKSDGNMTPLHWACFGDHAEIADLLLQQKRALVDLRTSDGRTPLHLAVMTRSFAAAELLLRRGASIEAFCNRSLQPIHYACENPDLWLVDLLLSSGAQIEARTRLGLRPLHLAAMRGYKPVVELLLEKKALIDAYDGSGMRAFSHACSHGHLDIVRLLMDRGSMPHGKGPMRSTPVKRGTDSPLCVAAKAGRLPVVIELISRGVSVREQDEASWEPLRHAAFNGHVDIAEALLRNGASVLGLGLAPDHKSCTVAANIGFAPEVDWTRRTAIMNLLNAAEERERRIPQRLAADDPFLAVPAHGAQQQEHRFYELDSASDFHARSRSPTLRSFLEGNETELTQISEF